MKTTKWTIDPQHSEIQFKVKHLVITTVTGSFRKFTGEFTAGDSFENAQISFESTVDSITTNNEQRDEHLLSDDFFSAATYPKITFKSTSFTKVSAKKFELQGDLTIKGRTLPVNLDVRYGGTGKDPWGNTKAGFAIKGKINRRDFGLTWNAVTETGGLLVGEDIAIVANIQLLAEVPATA